jgi:hypothetical protein
VHSFQSKNPTNHDELSILLYEHLSIFVKISIQTYAN